MVQRGVNVVVVNASYGGPSFSQAEKNAIDSLAASGVVFCAAAGNESADNDSTASYPANYTSANLISVAATDNRDALANFSNFGASTVDLAAPGALIYSTVVASYDASVRLNDAAYPAETFLYSGLTEELTRPYYDCGLGGSLADFPPEVFGNIALIERGTFTFSEKIRNAMEMGAAAAVIYNQASAPADELINGTLGAPDDWIAAAAVSRNTGLALLPAADNGTLLTLSVSMNDASAYAYQSGTSMAAPMVSGAIAMLARHFPEDGVAERIQRLYDALDPLPQLSGAPLPPVALLWHLPWTAMETASRIGLKAHSGPWIRSIRAPTAMRTVPPTFGNFGAASTHAIQVPAFLSAASRRPLREMD